MSYYNSDIWPIPINLSARMAASQRVLAVLLHEEVGGAVDAEVGDHGWSLQPCHLVRLMTKVTPTKFARLRLTVVSRGMGARPYLNAKSVAPN